MNDPDGWYFECWACGRRNFVYVEDLFEWVCAYCNDSHVRVVKDDE